MIALGMENFFLSTNEIRKKPIAVIRIAWIEFPSKEGQYQYPSGSWIISTESKTKFLKMGHLVFVQILIKLSITDLLYSFCIFCFISKHSVR